MLLKSIKGDIKICIICLDNIHLCLIHKCIICYHICFGMLHKWCILLYGPNPFVIDIEDASEENNNFRTALWTGNNLQVTLMSIGVGDDIGLEVHTSGDQFIRIEEGEALVKMGDSQDNLDFQRRVSDGYAIMIPAGKWHDIVNLGNKPLKLYVIYAPPQHPQGTVHNTKNDAEAAEFNRIY